MVAQIAQSSLPLTYAYSSGMGACGRVCMPVQPSEVLYSYFEHVSGMAAAQGMGTVSIDRLKILNSLIERLQSIKSQPLAAREAPESLSSDRIDALIQEYGAELHAMASASKGPYAAPAMAAESGMLFSLAA